MRLTGSLAPPGAPSRRRPSTPREPAPAPARVPRRTPEDAPRHRHRGLLGPRPHEAEPVLGGGGRSAAGRDPHLTAPGHEGSAGAHVTEQAHLGAGLEPPRRPVGEQQEPVPRPRVPAPERLALRPARQLEPGHARNEGRRLGSLSAPQRRSRRPRPADQLATLEAKHHRALRAGPGNEEPSVRDAEGAEGFARRRRGRWQVLKPVSREQGAGAVQHPHLAAGEHRHLRPPVAVEVAGGQRRRPRREAGQRHRVEHQPRSLGAPRGEQLRRAVHRHRRREHPGRAGLHRGAARPEVPPHRAQLTGRCEVRAHLQAEAHQAPRACGAGSRRRVLPGADHHRRQAGLSEARRQQRRRRLAEGHRGRVGGHRDRRLGMSSDHLAAQLLGERLQRGRRGGSGGEKRGDERRARAHRRSLPGSSMRKRSGLA